MKIIKILFVSVIVLMCNKTQAQTVQGGVKASLNFAQLNALGWQSNYNTTPAVGAYVNVGPGRIALQVEALYTNQTVKTASNFKDVYKQYLQTVIDSSVTSGSYTFTKLQVPVLGCFKFNKKFWVQAGAVFNNTISVIDKNSFQKTTSKIFSTNDIHFCGGFWIGFTKKWSAHARYMQSVSDVNNIKTLIQNPNADSKKPWGNQYIQVGAGFRIF